jgi:transposase-like protein
MATSKKRRVFTAAEKAAILAEAAESTATAVGKAHGINPQMLYAWKAAKKKRRQTKRAAKQTAKAAPSNGQSNGASSKTKPGRAASLDAVHAQLTDALASVEALRTAFRKVFGVDA